ncbi:tRNA adenosine(34) deaminase TadA [bacterium]
MKEETHEYFMKEALKEALKAYKKQEVPIGAVLVYKDKIIARSFNQTIKKNDPTAHAEILAIQKAAKVLKNYRLLDTTLYVTLEPCAMCAGAIVWARIKKLVYATVDEKAGASGSVFNIVNNKKLNHRVNVIKGIYEYDCKQTLQKFFQERRY